MRELQRIMVHALALALCPLFSGWAAAESIYRMEGTVTDIDTGMPVANAKVGVLIESEPVPEKRLREATTNVEGQYSIPLPVGHAWAFSMTPPPGFVPAAESNGVEGVLESVFATTDDSPVFTKNYQVRRGVPLRVALRTPAEVPAPSNVYVSLVQQQETDPIRGYCKLDSDLTGTVTLPQLNGTFLIRCNNSERTIEVPETLTIAFDKGFDPTTAKHLAAEQDSGATVARDAVGLAATLRGCDATIDEAGMTVIIDAKVTRSTETTEMRGRVVNASGEGLKDAYVRLAFVSSGGGAVTGQVSARANDSGQFLIHCPKLRTGQRVSLVITCDGYLGTDTEPMELAVDDSTFADAGTIQLDIGASVTVQVVGPDGSPLHGAIVRPGGNGFAQRSAIARTDANGECTLSGLAAGLGSLSGHFGNMQAVITIPLDPGANEPIVLRLSPISTERSTEEPRPVLLAGTPAPELTIAEWTDGKDRRISDYRGKVVVLDFWGVWCGPCINAIPAMKELHQRFKHRDVVFLGIHTAGTDLSVVQRLLRDQQWDIICGLDVGTSISTGTTAQRYAVQGYPTTVVVDRIGTVSFSSSYDAQQKMRDMQRVADAAGVTWPPSKEITDEQLQKILTRLRVAWLSDEIEAALDVQGK